MGTIFSTLFPTLWNTRPRRGDYAAYRRTSHNGIIVAVIGRTGSGMSQFIHDATGSYQTGVSPDHGLYNEPYTDTIHDYGFTVPGIDFADFPLVFIDTPGYDFTNNNNEYSTLRGVRTWLEKFKSHTELDGLIFMHNICTNEINRRQFLPEPSLLSNLCGTNWGHKILLVTTHWDQLEDDSSGAKEEEISKYWSSMPKRGSTIKHSGRSRESAWNILKPLVKVAEDAREARLRRELGELKRVLPQDTLDEITSVLSQKTEFIQHIIARLGEKTELTDEEKRKYDLLNQEARELWERLEKVVDSAELERHFGAGRNRKCVNPP